MPKLEGVYADGRGGWYFKARLGKDPLTGSWVQVTRRGFTSAGQASKARRGLLAKSDSGQVAPTPARLTVNALLDGYLDGIDSDGRLSEKTRFDYRLYSDRYIRPILGAKTVREVTPAVILAWQRSLAKNGGVTKRQPLAPNSIRLARAPLAGAFKLAVAQGLVAVSPMRAAPPPRARCSIPKHWSPEQARQFLAAVDGDRLYPVWAFLMGSGLRIGELVWLRWENVDVRRRVVHVVDFASSLGYRLVRSSGKSRDAVRTIDLDDGLIRVLKIQRRLQAEERLATDGYVDSEFVFTRPEGGSYHPHTLSKQLGELSQAVGLPRLTAHGLRHTSATLMLASGVPPKVAAERLGHADAMLFTNLYSHVTPTMQREAADKIGHTLFG